MASFAQLAAIGLTAGKPLIDNSDVIYDKARDKVREVRRKSTTKVYEGKKGKDDRDDRDRDSKYDLGPARPRGGSGGDRYSKASRARSVGYADYSDSDDDDYRRSRVRDRDSRRRRSAPQYDEGYDSEGSIPPRDRQMVPTRDMNGRSVAQYGSSRYANSQYPATNRTKSENDRGSSTSDSDTSDLMDSEEDERQEKKKRRNEMLTGGIAAVATLNAAANVYNSMKARELRMKQLAEGSITKEEAKKGRYKNHMQDAATIGLAALSIKGAYAKWQGTVGKHNETKAHREERKQRQEKRIRKGISRKNDEAERREAARRGRLAPGYEETARANRPGYNRTYSRSVDAMGSPYYGYQGGDPRSYGRSRREYGPYGGRGQRGHDSSDMYNGMEEMGDMAGYDTHNA